METRHSGRRRKGWREEGRQSGGRKRGSGPRTKLKSRGRNSSDLKRYSISRGASARPSLTRQEGNDTMSQRRRQTSRTLATMGKVMRDGHRLGGGAGECS